MKKTIFLILIILCSISMCIGISDMETDIIIHSRIPRTISLVLSGVGLSLAGIIMQQLSMNRFSSPSIMGVNDCTLLGLSIALLFFSSSNLWICVFIGFAFACIGMLLITRILDIIIIKDPLFIPLIGIMFGKVIQAIYLYIGYSYNILQDLQTWMLGDFSSIMTNRFELLYLIIPLVIVSYIYSVQLTMIGFGETISSSLGLDYNKIKYLGIFIVSMISSTTILIAGYLPFIGLIVPNIVNMFYGSNISKNLFYICSFGSILTLFCDIIARIVRYPFEVPISLILGLIGSIIFIILILNRKRGDMNE